MFDRFRASVLATLTVVGASCAHAELVANGGFETGDFAGWSVGGGPADVTAADAHTGAFGAGFASSTTTVVAQTLSTQAGTTYDISFWFRYDGPAINDFSFDWDGGADEYVLTNVNPGYGTFTFVRAATSDQTELAFSFRTGDGRWRLDDVSVTAAPGGRVPVPGTAALLAPALALLLRRRRTGSSA